MPTYVYECAKCGDEVEVWQSFSDEPLKRHAECGGKLSKVFQPVGIVLKGSGFYRTDNRSSAKRGSGEKSEKSEKAEKSSEKSEKSSSNGSGSGSSNGAGDSKKESKTDSKSSTKPSTSGAGAK